MGQYFKLINLDKREVVNPHDIGGLAKLFEWCANRQAGVIPYLLRKSSETGGGDVDDPDELEYAGRWAGDRIALVGDYDESNLYDQAEAEYTNISKGLAKEYNDFIQLDDLKLGKTDFMTPDMVIGGDGIAQNPKIDTREG